MAVGTVRVSAQSGLSFEEFKVKLQKYFDDDLIEDVRAQLPTADRYAIWGWDVGDFSGDGYPDIIFGFSRIGVKNRMVEVVALVDIDGYLTPIERKKVPYIDLPIEVGVSVKDGAFSVVRKVGTDHWTIESARFDNGAVVDVSSFETVKQKAGTLESTTLYSDLRAIEKMRDSRTSKVVDEKQYQLVPTYRRGRYLYNGQVPTSYCGGIDNVPRGAFWWEGERDCSFRVRTAYSEEHLYVLVDIVDDAVVAQRYEQSGSERVEVWIDAGNISLGTERRPEVMTDSAIFVIKINPADFSSKRPEVSVSATGELTDMQREAVDNIVAMATLSDSGWVAKVRIPFQFLGFAGAPVDDEKPVSLGINVAVADVDREFWPDEETVLVASPAGVLEPSRYGRLMLIPDGIIFGKTRNIWSDAVYERLREVGL